jgi:hypothetical protein
MRPVSSTLTQDRLKELMHYEPETGSLIWLQTRGGRAQQGSEAGAISTGYVRPMVDGQRYLAQRLIWFYMTGEWPSVQVDHEDRDRANNRWKNLRLATKKQNGENRKVHKNSKTGFRGVSWEPASQRYRSTILNSGARYWLGSHDTIIDAVAARLGAERQLFTHAPH